MRPTGPPPPPHGRAPHGTRTVAVSGLGPVGSDIDAVLRGALERFGPVRAMHLEHRNAGAVLATYAPWGGAQILNRLVSSQY